MTFSDASFLTVHRIRNILHSFSLHPLADEHIYSNTYKLDK